MSDSTDLGVSERKLQGFVFEATLRCNLDCRHCDVNEPVDDKASKKRELGVDAIGRLGAEAAALGASWCVIGGGEPLLRKDFFDIYQALLSKGLLISVVTNATLVTDEHIRFFRKFPPRDIEVAVFGTTRETHERVTRTAGSFAAFKRGLDKLLGSGVTVRFKPVALRSNKHELAAMADFCRAHAKAACRFDPHLRLRADRDSARNAVIRAERLSPREVARLERTDAAGASALEAVCAELLPAGTPPPTSAREARRIFRCGAGRRSFVASPDGVLRPCQDLRHPVFLYRPGHGSLADAWSRFFPEVLARATGSSVFLDKCAECPVASLCFWCPAHAHLETGELDRPIEDFCEVAEARAEALRSG